MKHTTLLIALALCTTNALAGQINNWSTETHTPHFLDVNGNSNASKGILLQAKSPDTDSLLLLDDTTQSVVPIELANVVVTLADVDGDGFSDIFAVYKDDRVAMTYLGYKDGFRSAAAHQYNVDSLTWLGDTTDISLIAGDFNGDNRQDIVVVSAQKRYVMHAGVNGQLSVVQTINGNAKWGNDRTDKRIIKDFNGDGRDDLFFQAKQKNKKHTIIYADSNGYLKNKNSHKITAKITGTDWNGDDYSIGAGNIDDDKAVELVLFNNASGGIDENGIIVQGKAAATSNH
ncbi:MAG: VCBS repeat-containing protein, partial [Algicola sp.]|nr:VCBS repeat-containing protein [Algicola sp.]